MKIIVIGNVQFTLEMLRALKETSSVVVGVITSEDSGVNSDYVNLGPYCEELSIDMFRTDDINADKTLRWIKGKNADVIFCLGWSHLINKEILGAVPLGVIGYHPARLPQNRGRHPLIWALVLGLEETASTFFSMDEGVDSGDILSQVNISINPEDDAYTLYGKITQIAAGQLQKLVSNLSDGSCQRIPQDSALANCWRKRGLKDGVIDWRMSAVSIHNLIRGLTHPYIGAHFDLNGISYKVWKSKVKNVQGIENVEPGKVLAVEDEVITVRCGHDCIELLNIEPIPDLKIGEYL